VTNQKNINLDEDELELLILQKFVEHYSETHLAQKRSGATDNKCQRELNMGEVLHEITGWKEDKLEVEKEHWFGTLVSTRPAYREIPKYETITGMYWSHKVTNAALVLIMLGTYFNVALTRETRLSCGSRSASSAISSMFSANSCF